MTILFSETSVLLILPIVFFVLVVLIAIIIFYNFINNNNNNSTTTTDTTNDIKDLKAIIALADYNSYSRYYIRFEYTNPNSFGEGELNKPLFYLIDCSNDICPDPNDGPKHPDPLTLMNQYYTLTDSIGNKVVPMVTFIDNSYDIINANVIGTINEEEDKSKSVSTNYLIDPEKFKPIKGKNYLFGIAIQKHTISENGIPNVLPYEYGDFKYVVLNINDPEPPGTITFQHDVITYNY